MIVDTNAISALATGDAAVLTILRQHRKVSLPFIAVAEYEYGIQRSSKREELAAWMDRLLTCHEVLYADRDTLTLYAQLRCELQQQGTPIPANDIWIGALARQTGLPVLSRDTHFDHIRHCQRVSW